MLKRSPGSWAGRPFCYKRLFSLFDLAVCYRENRFKRVAASIPLPAYRVGKILELLFFVRSYMSSPGGGVRHRRTEGDSIRHPHQNI